MGNADTTHVHGGGVVAKPDANPLLEICQADAGVDHRSQTILVWRRARGELATGER